MCKITTFKIKDEADIEKAVNKIDKSLGNDFVPVCNENGELLFQVPNGFPEWLSDNIDNGFKGDLHYSCADFEIELTEEGLPSKLEAFNENGEKVIQSVKEHFYGMINNAADYLANMYEDAILHGFMAWFSHQIFMANEKGYKGNTFSCGDFTVKLDKNTNVVKFETKTSIGERIKEYFDRTGKSAKEYSKIL